MWCMVRWPRTCGYQPVMNEQRLGVHTVAWTKALRKETASEATRPSSTGVETAGWPMWPRASPRHWSGLKMTMWGRLGMGHSFKGNDSGAKAGCLPSERVGSCFADAGHRNDEGPWGRGHLALARADRRAWPTPPSNRMRLAAHSEGKMPSPPGPFPGRRHSVNGRPRQRTPTSCRGVP